MGDGWGRGMAFAPKNLVVVTDNTMGIPGGEIDDGLALLYLLGCPERAHVEALCATHGNDTTERTYGALCGLVRELGLEDVPVLRGAAAGDASTSDAAREIVRRAQEAPGGRNVGVPGGDYGSCSGRAASPGNACALRERVPHGRRHEAPCFRRQDYGRAQPLRRRAGNIRGTRVDA